jgi:hypothetical protein
LYNSWVTTQTRESLDFSIYATVNEKEMVAEAFTSWHLGGGDEASSNFLRQRGLGLLADMFEGWRKR